MSTVARRALVVAPMRSELRPLTRSLGARAVRLAGAWVHRGRAGGTSVTVALIGVGPGPAGRATRRLLEAERFDHVVLSGIAGGIGPGVAVGDLVVPAEVEDLTDGRRFTASPLGGWHPSGVVGTTAAELILDEGRLAELTARGVVALDMESAAVAEACEGRGVPWSVFRAVSDRPEDGLLDDDVFGLLEADGSVNAGRALRYVAARPARARPLARLVRDATRAARRAAEAALEACASW
jgi:adenosylhomocysteine nucleosidase